ncbi:hypothetical protein Tco_0714343 [Tanacetum coccineum]
MIQPNNHTRPETQFIDRDGVGERNWLDMMIVYCREFTDEHRDFALRVNSVAYETVPAKTAAFLEEMINKEGSMEWQLCDLEKEAREMAFEIESFLLKLMDEEPSHRRIFRGD